MGVRGDALVVQLEEKKNPQRYLSVMREERKKLKI